MTILIVDDSAPMRRTLKAFVGELAEGVHECGDGREALAAYEQHRPDWVLMDIKMKEMDGLSATREIKSSYPEARIVMITDYDGDEFREAARAAGACAHVVKENLLEVRRILSPGQADVR